MRTPGDEKAHVAGFCLTEGLVDAMDDIAAIAFCDGEDTHVATATLKPARLAQIGHLMDHRGFVSQTGCGICGKTVIDDLCRYAGPLSDGEPIDIERSYQCLVDLAGHQPLRGATRASHATVIYNADFAAIASAEDVGRHNALDKAIGKLFLTGRLGQAAFATLSSRISYEMVQKAVRAKIPILFSMSQPTALAVDLARKLRLTLACKIKKSPGLYVFTHAARLKGLRDHDEKEAPDADIQ
jgi:FdhD protein